MLAPLARGTVELRGAILEHVFHGVVALVALSLPFFTHVAVVTVCLSGCDCLATKLACLRRRGGDRDCGVVMATGGDGTTMSTEGERHRHQETSVKIYDRFNQKTRIRRHHWNNRCRRPGRAWWS